jgi:hypothetical protein
MGGYESANLDGPYRTQIRFTFRLGAFQFFFRQRMKRFAAKLKSGSVRLMIHQALALCALHGGKGAGHVVDA